MPDLSPPPLSLIDGAALFLDFDGTLVELAETPDAIDVPLALGRLLERLKQRLDNRLAIVSGRSIADLARHVPCSDIRFSGSHGLELRLADGTDLPLSAPDELDDALERVTRFAQGRPGLLVEKKPMGVALHYRRAPDAAAEISRFMADIAARSGLTLQHGHMVVELRPSGSDKGDALRAFMTEPEFAGARPVFVGDDLTDEHAFEAAATLGGAGILVGPARDTAARFRLDSVNAVTHWLEKAAA